MQVQVQARFQGVGGEGSPIHTYLLARQAHAVAARRRRKTVESCKERKSPLKNVFHVDEKRLDQGTN